MHQKVTAKAAKGACSLLIVHFFFPFLLTVVEEEMYNKQ